jgi:hypothetical protein
LHRTLVADLAVGFARTDDPNRFKVGQYLRFISLDGVDWSDRAAKAKMYVGKAIIDFMDRERDPATQLKLVKKDTVGRVVGSAAMKMSDSNLLFAQHAMAGVGTPIVVNNACLSWHRLAGNMMVSGARAYVGTLFPVTPFEAAEVVTKILENHWGKPLPIALWAAQRDVYKSDPRRPYVVAGVFPQWLRVEPSDYPGRIRRQIGRSLAGYREMLAGTDEAETKRVEAIKAVIKFLEREFDHFEDMAKEGAEGTARTS